MAMFHPYEIVGDNPEKDKIRRNDLPDFKEPEDVMEYLANNNHVNMRGGKFVRLNWLECNNVLCATCNKAN